uniref:Uncharacterized protein n=1 Tax=Knipowitschia caucasica TaxID=637954 RepID=A0AAV2LFU1_KNICA
MRYKTLESADICSQIPPSQLGKALSCCEGLSIDVAGDRHQQVPEAAKLSDCCKLMLAGGSWLVALLALHFQPGF